MLSFLPKERKRERNNDYEEPYSKRSKSEAKTHVFSDK